MKCTIPEIAWHNRDPVLSVDFQPQLLHGGSNQKDKEVYRLATGGCDSHIVIWYIKVDDSANATIEVAADLFHHQKAVNVVRWSPSGEYLASGDDESAIIIWKQKTDVEPPPLFEQNSDQDRETWNVYKILRGHVEDVYDLSWCPMSKCLISGSVDNTAIAWDVHKGKSLGMLHHKGFVQGVMWDPNNQYLATMSSDRVFRVFDVNTRKAIARSSKGALPVSGLHPLKGQTVRFYHDDTLQSFFRRLDISPDGELIAVPTGFIEGDAARGIKNMNTAYVYSRYSLQIPVCVLPCGDSPALAVRWSPVKYIPRKDGPAPLIEVPSGVRMILAVGTNDSITIYDTQQSTPLAIVLNPQYARLTDMTWSSDGSILIVSSSDGYCSIITFAQNELGEISHEVITKNLMPKTNVDKKMDEPMEVDPPNKDSIERNVSDIKEAMKTKELVKTLNSVERKNISLFDIKSESTTPKGKSPKPKSLFGVKKEKAAETKPSTVVIDEAAMEPWSQDGFASKMKKTSPAKVANDIIIDDPTQDIKLVYDDTDDDKTNKKTDEKQSVVLENKSNEKQIPEKGILKSETKIIPDTAKPTMTPAQESKPISEMNPQAPSLPKTPRRVSFITLSSPKNKKKPLV